MTGLAVWLTLRADRRARDEADRGRELVRLFQEARGLKGSMLRGDATCLTRSFDWCVDARILAQALAVKEPCFSTLLLEAAEQASVHGSGSGDASGLQLSNVQNCAAALTNAERILQRRLNHPEWFKMSKTECDGLRTAIADGGFIS